MLTETQNEIKKEMLSEIGLCGGITDKDLVDGVSSKDYDKSQVRMMFWHLLGEGIIEFTTDRLVYIVKNKEVAVQI